uniref:Uncharacterized protein n=1 Tax=Zea mays TaxID=4577 RepID=C4J707_MAIZE|nr:unknown [Zea mays]
MAIKPSSIVILELPAVKIAWLDSGALACSACQRADALAVDTLRFFSLACTKYYSNNALSTAKPAYLRARTTAGEAWLCIIPLGGIVDLSLVEHRDTYSHGDADDAHRNGHNRVLVEVNGPDARVPRSGPSPSGQRRHVGRGRGGREEAGVERCERRGGSGHGCVSSLRHALAADRVSGGRAGAAVA